MQCDDVDPIGIAGRSLPIHLSKQRGTVRVESEGTSSLPAAARLRIATGWLRLDERAKHLGPPILKVAVSLESAL